MKSIRNVSAILLAGGHGTRMNRKTPKQYLKLRGKEIATYSLECFSTVAAINEIVVVCHDEYIPIFNKIVPEMNLTFAQPGKRRQDSVYNGFKALKHTENVICIHDTARPFINKQSIDEVINAAVEYGAAALAVPMKCTVKQTDSHGFVTNTPNRSQLWEVQTPQVLTSELLDRGFTLANQRKVTVTDDVSLAELSGAPVKLVMGEYNNIKITTEEDLAIAEKIIEQFIGVPELQNIGG
ncbi:MAG: 2-C-methyl-D-erythritol 4-phosphate cytidylyltransferase [Chlamydiota bacterium]|nr:2-C-methyl-D-erythritol 4-phosphate cytidylyltransferase [Chlamydiota bacterium]